MRCFTLFLNGCMLPALLVSAAMAVDIVTVPIGNTGNAGELSGQGAGGNGPDAIVGAVDYSYNIGKYEVTAGQYCEFLNAVAAEDTYGLYNPLMDSDWGGCQITRHGDSGNYWYDFSGGAVEAPGSTAADWSGRPVNFVSWGDAARFANWLHNGRPGRNEPVPQDTNSTEDGAYHLDGAVSNEALMAINRESGWKWAITGEDEWYKAAYHKNDGATGNYFDYPTASDTVPGNVLETPDPGNNATFIPIGGSFTIGYPYWRTEHGAHENSGSPYGAFDQGGNLWEWNECRLDGSLYRGTRGGSFLADDGALQASIRGNFQTPATENNSTGFRVVNSFGPGDANGDGRVDVSDLGVLTTHYGAGSGFGWSSGDFTGNSIVDVSDLGVLATYYGTGKHGAQVPEPGSLVLLLWGLASLLFCRCRK